MQMDFPTEEEQYEFQYEDDMEVMQEMDNLDSHEPDLFDFMPEGAKKIFVNKNPNYEIQKKVSRIPQNIEKKNNEDENSQETYSSQDILYEKICSSQENLHKLNKSYINREQRLFNEDNNINVSEKYNNYISTSTSTKRTFSESFDVSYEISPINSAKRICSNNPKAIVENFLKDIIQTQANPTLFPETSNRFRHDQVVLTNSEGERIYFHLHDEDDEKNIIPSFSKKTNSLLVTPIETLKLQCLMEEEKKAKNSENSYLELNVIDNLTDILDKRISESSLWVEKYKPLSYMHLLSEEGINRTLLQWLKLWDKVVFGKEKKIRKKTADPHKASKMQKSYGELVEELDEYGRPFHKVAFLCGPPGLGKTTLAIIIAKHVGYNVVELNASDDRNPEAFRTSLEAATQMKSVVHQDNRPNCLILDEIDGAPAASINVLLSFIKSTGVPKGKRKKGDIPLLLRPIICICNDQYSAALKPLRQISLLLNFPPTASDRLTSRLNEVALREGLKAEIGALNLLCEKTSNDIRSCLSTLQFIFRHKKELKASDLNKMPVGQKDMQKSLFMVWQEIFQFIGKKSYSSVLKTIQAFGDYDKVFIGLFENYTNIKFKHKTLGTICEGPEWLCFADMLQQHILQTQQYILLPYLPYPAVAFHMFYSSSGYSHIAYPSSYYENRVKISNMQHTLSSIMKEIVLSLKNFLSPSMLTLHVLPFLIEILKPSLRPVNTQLYSEREKKELKRVIELMISFNLNYRQERSQDGIYKYILDPNLEEIVQFPGFKSKRILAYAAKQLIARETEVERMRKDDTSQSKSEESIKKTKSSETIPKTQPAFNKTTATEKPTLDFFGRKIEKPVDKDATNEKFVKYEQVWYHFKEGYSNAVRRPAYIKDFL